MTLVILVSIIVLGVILLVLRASRGAQRDLASVRASIQDLLERGYDNGFLLIQIAFTNRFLQFEKYVTSSAESGVQMAFPRAKWAEPFFEAIREYCRLHKLDACVVNEGMLDFLYVDFGKDIELACKSTIDILQDVFHVSQKTKLFMRLENASPHRILRNPEHRDA